MSRTEVFRDGKVHVQETKCPTCIYRPGNLMRLDPGRKEEMEAGAIAGGGVIPCHQTIDAYHGKKGQESVCRGFFDVAKQEGLLQAAERMGIVEFTTTQFLCPACQTSVDLTPALAPHPSKDTRGLCAMSGLLPATATLWFRKKGS